MTAWMTVGRLWPWWITSNYKLYYCEGTATAKRLQLTIKEVRVSKMYTVAYSTSCSTDDEFITDVSKLHEREETLIFDLSSV